MKISKIWTSNSIQGKNKPEWPDYVLYRRVIDYNSNNCTKMVKQYETLKEKGNNKEFFLSNDRLLLEFFMSHTWNDSLQWHTFRFFHIRDDDWLHFAHLSQ